MCETKDSYPIEILPKKSYKRKLCIEKLLGKYHDLMVVRQVKGDCAKYKMMTESGDIEWDDSIFGRGMANLSLNLAGGVFNTNSDAHLRFLPISSDASALWDGKAVNPQIVSEENSYSFDSQCFGLCLLVKKIHDRTFPFYKFFDNKAERDEYAQKVTDVTSKRERQYDAHLVGAFKDKRSGVKVHPHIEVKHAPTKANYWHATLDTYRPTDKNAIMPTDKLDSSDKRMFKALKQDLKQYITINNKPNYRLTRYDYIKWQYWLCVAFI